MEWLKRYLSADDLMSLLGYIVIMVVARVTNPESDLATASLLASGMLTLFWLFSRSARDRNADRQPNVRVIVWASVAVISVAIVLATQ